MSISSVSASLHSVPLSPEVMPLDERSLARAFASFTEAAQSLERSYAQLQSEVARLRRELEETNRDLGRSLEENRRMRLHLDRILKALPCGVLVVEKDGRVSIANAEAQRLMGISSLPSLERWEQAPEWATELLGSADPGGKECEHQGAPGAEDWMAVRRAQLLTGGESSSIFILRDITESKRLQETQETLRRRQALAEMSALLAHEIRNPLGSLELLAGLLADSPLEEQCQGWVDSLRAGLRMLSATVNNVLQFHGNPRLQLAPIDLGQLLHGLEEFLRPLARQAGVEIHSQHKLDGVLVSADRHRLEQVLLNLALNAFRFMPGGGVLKISGGVRAQDGRKSAVIEVADTGLGIPEENLDRIFEPGFTTRPGSPGLGLAVSKLILEQHGAKIFVTSAARRGTTFTLEFVLPETN